MACRGPSSAPAARRQPDGGNRVGRDPAGTRPRSPTVRRADRHRRPSANATRRSGLTGPAGLDRRSSALASPWARCWSGWRCWSSCSARAPRRRTLLSLLAEAPRTGCPTWWCSSPPWCVCSRPTPLRGLPVLRPSCQGTRAWPSFALRADRQVYRAGLVVAVRAGRWAAGVLRRPVEVLVRCSRWVCSSRSRSASSAWCGTGEAPRRAVADPAGDQRAGLASRPPWPRW